MKANRLQREIFRLRSEVKKLKEEKADLETMLEMNLEHSDNVVDDLLDKVEITLSDSEKRFRVISETAPVPILVSRSTDGKILFANNPAANLFNLPVAELLKHKIVDFYAPNYIDIINRRLGEKGFLCNFEMQGIKPDKSTFWTDLSLQPFKYNDTSSLLAVFYDLSERKQAEEELEKVKNYLRNILNSMPSILIGIDNSGIVTLWNKEAAAFTGLAVEDATGKTLEKAFPLLANELRDIIKIIKTGENHFHRKIHNKTSEGEFHYDVMLYPLVDTINKGAVLRIDDVTKQVNLEKVMIQTEKMMSIGGMAAGIAHEINNPLSIIVQSAQNIDRRFSCDIRKNILTAEACGIDLKKLNFYMEKRKVFNFLDSLKESSLRASEIIASMLQFSRKSGSLKNYVSIPSILDNSLRLASNDYDLKKEYDFRHIKIIKEFEPKLPEILCVDTEIEQVILNLLKNSAQAMSELTDSTEKTIILRLKKEAQKLRIEIEDNGPGISKEIQKKIFEPFFTTKPIGIGTGLGLSVSYFIITNNHAGQIEIKSSPGNGSCFIIKLPINLP